MMTMLPILRTPLGHLYQVDCMTLLNALEPESVDLAFADPPFNLGKLYTSKIDDAKASHEYLTWCQTWLEGMVRSLKPGGSLFVWNLPKWNLSLGAFLNEHLTFRHWITVDIKYSMPIQGRLYPAHYSLLYFVKGTKPAIFHPDRLAIACCRHCGGELKDYGGYKDKMNPNGINLSDVWTDIPPVRHNKYKKRDANALPLKLMDRIVAMSSDPESLVLDPFGGSGTTYVAAELTGRRWIGSELDCSSILDRFGLLEPDENHLTQIHASKNTLFTDADLERQRKSGKTLSKNYRINTNVPCSCEPSKQENLFSVV
jgi:site-specific DNA-methyltransferase (adenine-specific)